MRDCLVCDVPLTKEQVRRRRVVHSACYQAIRTRDRPYPTRAEIGAWALQRYWEEQAA